MSTQTAPTTGRKKILGNNYFLHDSDRISDEQLLARHGSAISILEMYWAEIGWDLARVRNRSDVVRVFSARELQYSSAFDFLRTPARESKDTLPALRHQSDQASSQMRAAYRDAQEMRQLHDRVQSALNDSGADQLEMQVRFGRLKEELIRAESICKHLRELDERLQEEKTLAEAAFSQNELVRLVNEKRYTIDPFTVSCAIAGLPFISYRQSINRCKGLGARQCVHLRYEVFRAIAFLCDSIKKQEPDLSEQVRNLPSRFRSAREELMKNFYFFRKAVEQISATNHRRAELPFSIASTYNELMSPISLIEELRARDQRLR